MQWKRFVLVSCIAVFLASASFVLGCMLRSLAQSGKHAIAFAQGSADKGPGLPATSKSVKVDGKEIGVVLMNEKEVLRLNATSGGNSPTKRAQIVAGRINRAVTEGVPVREFRTSTNQGKPAVRAGDILLVTVETQDAEAPHKNPSDLASRWSDRIADEVLYYYKKVGLSPSGEWKPAEAYDDKWVPIVSVLSGLKVGAARINGPRSKLKMVQAVAQIEANFKEYLDIDVYLPISTKVPGRKLDVVHECAVTGLGDIDL